MLFLSLCPIKKKKNPRRKIDRLSDLQKAQQEREERMCQEEGEEHGVLATEGRVLVTVSLDNQWQPMESIPALPHKPWQHQCTHWPCGSAWTDREGESESRCVCELVCLLCTGRKTCDEGQVVEADVNERLPAFATSTVHFANRHAVKFTAKILLSPHVQNKKIN